MNDLDDAMTDHSRSLELDENDSDPLRERGSLFAELGIEPSACADWKKASSLGDTRSTTTFRKTLKYVRGVREAVSVTPPTNRGNHT